MMKNDNIKLGEVAEFRNGVNYDESNFGKGIKIINVANFKDYSTPKYEELGEINPNDLIKEDDLLQKGDIVFVRSNGNKNLIGRTLYIDEIDENLTYSAFCIRARFISKECNPKFYSYLFKTDFIRKTLSSQGNGTNISNLNQKILNNLVVPLLSMDKQDKIVAILSKYDELIENNIKRIKLLEESIELTYKEWFVNLRFPGYENCNIVNGIPEGWKKNKIGDSNIFKLIKDNIKNFEGKKTYYATADIDGINIVNNGIRVTYEEKPSRAQKKPELYSVWFARMSNTYKILGINDKNKELVDSIILSSGFAGLRVLEKENYPYLYSFVKSEYFSKQKDSYATGSTQVSLNNTNLGKIEYLEPSKDILKKYSDYIVDILNQIEVLKKQNKKLKESRDMLIPKLISGEIEV